MDFRSKQFRNFILCAGTGFKVLAFSLLVALTSLFHYIKGDVYYLGQILSADYGFRKPGKSRRHKLPFKPKASLQAQESEHVVVRKKSSFNQSLNLFVQTADKFLCEPLARETALFSDKEISHSTDYLKPVLSRSPPLFS